MNTIRLTAPNTIALKSANVIYLVDLNLPAGYKPNTASTIIGGSDVDKKTGGSDVKKGLSGSGPNF